MALNVEAFIFLTIIWLNSSVPGSYADPRWPALRPYLFEALLKGTFGLSVSQSKEENEIEVQLWNLRSFLQHPWILIKNTGQWKENRTTNHTYDEIKEDRSHVPFGTVSAYHKDSLFDYIYNGRVLILNTTSFATQFSFVRTERIDYLDPEGAFHPSGLSM